MSMMTTPPQLTEPNERDPGSGGARPPVTRPFRTPVRGHAFAARAPGASEPSPGQLARLVREPANPADRYAVGVWVADAGGRWRIGYLDRSVAARVAPRLDEGARIAVQVDGWTPEPDGRWRRPLVVLLPERDGADRVTSGPRDRRASSGSTSGPVQLWGRPPGVTRRVLRPG